MSEEAETKQQENGEWEKTNPLTPNQNKFILATIIIAVLLIVAYLASGIIEMLNHQNGG